MRRAERNCRCTGVKQTIAAAHDQPVARCWVPRETEARRDVIEVVVDVRSVNTRRRQRWTRIAGRSLHHLLNIIASSDIERQAARHTPVILKEEAILIEVRGGGRT